MEGKNLFAEWEAGFYFNRFWGEMMKKSICIAFVLFILTGILSAQNLKGPAIRFEKTEVDFAQVAPDSLLRYTFEFQNSGTDTLSILKVRPG